MEATYHEDSDILHVTLSDEEPGAAVRQEYLDDLRIIDYSAAGDVLGIAFVAASEGINLTGVPSASLVAELIDRGDHRLKVLT